MSNDLSLYRLSSYRRSKATISTLLEMGIAVMPLRYSQCQWKHWSSTQIEQDASIVLGLYREFYYDPDFNDERLMEVGILKNRDGVSSCKIDFEFVGENQNVWER